MKELNDAPVLDQVRDQWQQIATVLLWKLAGRKVVKIEAKDIDAFNREFAPGIGVMFIHGMHDALEISLVDEKSAQRLIEHDTVLRGTS